MVAVGRRQGTGVAAKAGLRQVTGAVVAAVRLQDTVVVGRAQEVPVPEVAARARVD